MNRIFKTVWSSVRGCCVAAGENARSHGKQGRSKLTIAAAAAAMLGGGAIDANAYVDPGRVATGFDDVSGAVASWETDEYKKDWGLTALKASKAYALGFHGQGVAVGVMDSGALLQKHPDLAGSRFHASAADAVYGSTGDRYPQTPSAPGHYVAGESATSSGVIDGNWISGTNDSHGTHVTGTVGANRDGSEFHGVAWGADVWVGNTGGTDNTNYGPYQDYTFFYNGWKALADNLIAANGADRGGVINNSFGTNIRVVDNGSTGSDGGSTGVHFPTDTVSQTEYEYFLFNQVYGDGPTFVDAAYDAVKGTNVIQVFTTGNRDFANPFYRPLYPYFNPSAESNWVAVAGLKQGAGSGTTYELSSTWNEAGLAKWWTVAAPGSGIYGSKVDTSTGTASWGNSSGTSMAAPHVTGALTVLMSRYADMSAVQVRDVMFTTANHYNPDGSVMVGWTNTDGTTPSDGQVSDRMGWGVPDLDKGMYGPGQFLGEFNYNMATTPLDVWTNDISNVALDQRETEDAAWKAAAEKWLANPTLELGEGYTEEEKKLLGDILLNTSDDVLGLTDEQEQISEADAIAWRTKYYQDRIAAIDARVYDGSLVKSGSGTLVMTGENTYKGSTTVKGGMLLGFAESLGTQKAVTVEDGGAFGLLNRYEDTFTMTGVHESTSTDGSGVRVSIAEGGAYALVAGQDISIGSLDFAGTKKFAVTAVDRDVMKKVLGGESVSGTLTITSSTAADTLGEAVTVVPTDLALFGVDVVQNADGSFTGTMSRNDAAAADFASGALQTSVATALFANPNSEILTDMAFLEADGIRDTVASLSNDLHLSMQKSTLMNTASVARTVKDIASDFGLAKTAELDNGVRLWATGTGVWTSLDGSAGSADADADTYTGFVGADYLYGDRNKVGVFFGYGTTDFDNGSVGTVESNDLHFGIYGQSDWDTFGVGYGLIYTTQDRDGDRTLSVAGRTQRNTVSYDADVLQLFAEASYKGFSFGDFAVEPYLGASWMHLSADSFTEQVGQHSFTTDLDNQNVGTVDVGVRAKQSFMVGDARMAVKGDVAWMQFFGDNQATAHMTIGDSGTAQLEGDELNGMGVVSLGIEAEIGKSATLGVSYTGAFGSDVTSNGVGATVKILF